MRAVNLLPQQHRPVGPTGERSGSAYFVIGALVVMLAAAIAYVVVANQVTSGREEAASLSAQADIAEARVAELAPFGEFSALKEARVMAVSELATSRLDWERLARELSLVLPKDTWLTSVDGNTGTSPTAAAAAAPAPASGAAAEHTGPTVTLTGCAKSQPAVATTLVRLKRLNGASDVQLDSSTRESESKPKSTKGKAKDETAGAGSSSASEGCGKGYGFTATVELEPVKPVLPAGAKKPTQVPASLGGGS